MDSLADEGEKAATTDDIHLFTAPEWSKDELEDASERCDWTDWIELEFVLDYPKHEIQ